MQQHYLSTLFDPQAVLLVMDDGAPQIWAEPLRASSGPGPELEQRRLTQRPVPPIVLRTPDALDDPAAELPPGVRFELGVVAVAPDGVLGVIDRLAALGIRRLLVLTPPVDREQKDVWLERVRMQRMLMLGPASTGFVRPRRGLNLGSMGAMPPAGEIAVVTQSGALGAALLDWADAVGTGFSLVAAMGGEGDVDLAQVLDFVANDPHTRSVIVYLEAVTDARRFMSALRGLSMVKPVIVLKGQRSALRLVDTRVRVEGRDGAAPTRSGFTHSGAIAGSNAVFEAVLRRAGAVQIQIFAQIEITARYLAARSTPVGPRLGIIANGRGPAVLAVDQALINQVILPTLDGANPRVLGFDASPQAIVDAALELGNHEQLDALLILIAPYRLIDTEEMARLLVGSVRSIGQPIFVAMLGSEGAREHRAILEQAGIPVFETPEAAVNAYANVANFHRNQKLLLQMPRPLSGLLEPDIDRARVLIGSALKGEARSTEGSLPGARLLDEVQSKALLADFHIPMIEPRPASNAEEAVALAAQIGYPVVLKIISPDVAHKSSVGGVALNLQGPREVAAAYAGILAAVGAAVPGARVDGVSVQAMRAVGGSTELYIGVFRDPRWGPVMAFGSGGVAVEKIRDVALELPPLNRYLARKLIQRVRSYPQLIREISRHGRLEADLDAIERVLLRVSEIVCELPEVIELDINPLIIDANGVTAVDARVVIAPAPPVGYHYSHMAIMPYPTYLEQTFVTKGGRPCEIRPVIPEDADLIQDLMRRLSPQARYFRFVSTLTEIPPRLLLRFTQIDYDREVALVVLGDPPEPAATAGATPGAAGGAETNTESDGGAEEKAADAVAAAAAEAITHAGPLSGAESATQAHDGAPPAPGQAARSDGKQIVGVGRYMLNADRSTCEFAIAIDDAWQGHGLGAYLMRSLVSLARSRGLSRIEGHVLGNNSPMLGLMKYLGFKVATDRDEPDMRLVWRDLQEETESEL